MFSLRSIVADLPRRLEVYDIGARIEGEPRYASLIQHWPASVTAFEPRKSELDQLESLGSHVRVLPYALGDGSTATFHVTRWPGNCSLFEPDPSVIDCFCGIGAAAIDGNFHVVRTENVRTFRLDDLEGLPSPDCIKLDIQGAELSVLSNGRRQLSHALVVESEVLFVPLYRDQPLFGEMQSFMREAGFLFHRFLDMQGRCWRPFAATQPVAVSQPLWADAIFVRDPTRIALWTDEDLLVGAVILHEMYRSFDLVLKLLSDYDRRRGTAHSSLYLAKVREESSIQQVLPAFRLPAT